MTLDELKSWLDGMPADQRKELLNSLYASYDERGEQLSQEQTFADKLREEPMPGMRDTGKFMVAANPLEFASTVAHRGLGSYQSKKIAEQRETMAKAKEKALQTLVAQKLEAAGSMGGPAAAPPMMGAMNPQMNLPAMLQGLRRPGSG